MTEAAVLLVLHHEDGQICLLNLRDVAHVEPEGDVTRIERISRTKRRDDLFVTESWREIHAMAARAGHALPDGEDAR